VTEGAKTPSSFLKILLAGHLFLVPWQQKIKKEAWRSGAFGH
jgi:hypothetical protein